MGLDGGTIATRTDLLRRASWRLANSDGGAQRSTRGGQLTADGAPSAGPRYASSRGYRGHCRRIRSQGTKTGPPAERNGASGPDLDEAFDAMWEQAGTLGVGANGETQGRS